MTLDDEDPRINPMFEQPELGVLVRCLTEVAEARWATRGLRRRCYLTVVVLVEEGDRLLRQDERDLVEKCVERGLRNHPEWEPILEDLSL